MRWTFFIVILSLFITGCIPKQVDKKPVKNPTTTQIQEPKLEPKIEKIVPKQPEVEKEIIEIEVEEPSKSYKVTMKTKKFAFSDTGFLVKSNKMLRLNVLAMGKPVLDLKVKNSDDICVGSLCNTKHGFNQSFLVSEYPDELIGNVLQGEPIFEGKNLKETTNGFIQRIKTDKYNIKYQTSKGSIYFKDKQNKIIMKLKELK